MKTEDARNWFPRPDEDPWYPDDLTTVDIIELGQLLHHYNLWRNYGSIQVAIMESDLLLLKETLEMHQAMELTKVIEDVDLCSKYKNVADRTAYVNSLSSVRPMMQQVSNARAELKVAQAVLDNFNDRYGAVSREMSRRQTLA